MTTHQTLTESEDWIKTRRWDLPTDMAGLTQALGCPLGQKGMEFKRWKALRDLTKLPAYKMCPPQLAHQIEMYIGRKPRTRWVGFVKAFNQDESRDGSGKWTTGAGSDGPGPKLTANEKRIAADDAKDRKPSKSMKSLVQRDNVITVGDLQPGDVMTSTNLDGSKDYITIEHIGSDSRVHMIGRKPSGRMAEMWASRASVLGGKNEAGFADMGTFNTPGWNYVGTEPLGFDHNFKAYGNTPHPLSTNGDIHDTRDDVLVPIAGFPPSTHRQIVAAVQLVEGVTPPGTLDGLKIRNSAEMAGNVYARMKPTGEMEINQNWISDPHTARDMGETRNADQQKTLGNAYLNDVRAKFHPNRNGYSALTSVVVHEIGHHLHMVRARADGVHVLNHAMDAYGLTQVSGRGVQGALSEYANRNFNEFTAEAFAEGVLADRPRAIAKYMTKALTGQTITLGDAKAFDKAMHYDELSMGRRAI
jgi:hypothetical protein